mgnify:CR=1 FL=1
MAHALLQVSGLAESVGQVVGAAGAIVLALMVVALVGFAYKSLRGDGIEWPDDVDDDEDGVSQGESDDEWDYY